MKGTEPMTSEAPQDVAALLREVAEKATKGPWGAPNPMWPEKAMPVYSHAAGMDQIALTTAPGYVQRTADAAYIAAASPDVVLGLLDQNDRLRSALEWALRNNGGECPADYPAGYAKALRVLRGSGAEEAARDE